MVIVYIIVGIFIVSMGIVAPSRKLQIAGALILYLLMILLAGLRYDGADILGYQYEFYTSENYGWDIWNEEISVKEVRQFGQLYLNKFFFENDFSFAEMRFYSITFMMTLLLIMLVKLTSAWPIVILIYLFFPYPIDTVQTRNTFMEICLLSAIYLFSIAKSRRYIKYISMIVVGASFHTMSLAYLPYLVSEKIKKYKLSKIFMVISALSPFYAKLIISNSVVILLSLAIDDSPLSRYMDYAEGRTSDAEADPYLYFLHTWLLVIVFNIYSWYMTVKTRNKYEGIIPPKKIRFIYVVNNLWQYCLLMLPVISLTPSLDRIPRNLLLPFYVALGIYFTYVDNKYCKWLVLLCVVTVALYSGIYTKSDFGFLISNFTKNYLFE